MRTLAAWLTEAAGRGIHPDLGPIQRAAAVLGLQPVPAVLVGGTNGKGSTVAFTVSALQAAGLRVGSAISPHLQVFRERVRVGGRPVPEGSLEQLAEHWLSDNRVRHTLGELSYFEVGILLALGHFGRGEVDVAVYEVGLGGEWDASRVCRPEVSVLAGVGLDHLEWLGPGITDVARTKARIAERGKPLLAGPLCEDVEAVVRAEVAKIGAPFLGWQDRWLEGLPPSLGLRGTHQRRNAALGLAAAQVLLAQRGIEVPEVADLTRGFPEVRFPARLEEVPGRPRVVLDGAHNPEGAAVLAAAWSAVAAGRPVLILGVMADKDVDGILDGLRGLDPVAIVACAGRSTPRYLAAESLAARCRRSWPTTPVRAVTGVAEAWDAARRAAGADGEVLCAGSLYLAGELRDVLGLDPG